MSSIKFTKSHEWVDANGKTAKVGISDYAQSELGDIVFVQLPEVGTELSQGDTLAEIESVKAVSEVYSPVTGKVVEVNEALLDNAALINESCYDAWFVKIEFTETAELMTEEEYLATL